MLDQHLDIREPGVNEVIRQHRQGRIPGSNFPVGRAAPGGCKHAGHHLLHCALRFEQRAQARYRLTKQDHRFPPGSTK